jgi:AraC-like DNA-binding protein
MKPVPMVSTAVTRGMVLTAAARGLSIPALLAAVGLSQEQLTDGEALLPLSVHLALWQQAAEMSGDDRFGLHMSESVPRGVFGLREYIIRNSPNLEAALRSLIRYQGLLIPNILRLLYEGATVRVEHALPRGSGPVTRHAGEFVIANMVRQIQGLVRMPVRPQEIWFLEPAPADLSEYARIFSCPVYFERPVNAFVLDRALLSLEVQGADAALAEILTRQADAVLARAGNPEGLVEKVQRVICTEMKGEAPALSRVARQLGLSPRNLQRRLQEEGTSFHKLLDQTCHEIAVHQIQKQRLPASEVAFLLGYSEVSAFHRAFRRWTGMSTAQFRKLSPPP